MAESLSFPQPPPASPASPAFHTVPSALLPASWLGTYYNLSFPPLTPRPGTVSALDPTEDLVYEPNPLPWEHCPHSRNRHNRNVHLNLAVWIPSAATAST